MPRVSQATRRATRRAPVRRAKPKRPYVKGRGGYWYVGGNASLNANLGKLGKASISGGGGYANKRVSRAVITGKGDYKIKRNVLYEGASMPMVKNYHRNDNATIIRHSEYICDIISSSTIGAFKNQSFEINAGNAQLFEYLAQVASNYTEYCIEGMIYEFRTRSCDALNSTNTALGSVYIASQYNSLEPDFSSKAEMSSYMYCNNCKPSESMIHIIECDPHQTAINQLYVRSGAVPSGADIRLYDLARLQIATQGLQAASVNIGELHVTYQVALYKPRLYQSLGYLNDFQLFSSTSQSVSPTSPLGSGLFSNPLSSAWTTNYNNIPLNSQDYVCMVTGGATGALTFRAPLYPMGVRMMYEIIWVWSVAKTQDAVAPVRVVADGAVDVTTDYFASASVISTPGVGVSSSTWTYRCVVDFPYAIDPRMQVTYQGTFPTDTPSNVIIRCCQIPNSS